MKNRLTFLTALLFAPLAVLHAAEAPKPKPNVLFILTDNQGAWTLGCHGNKDIHTPNLDRLAGEGVRFENAFANNPVCSPTRATWLTGLTPSQHGIHRYIDPKLFRGSEARDLLAGRETLHDLFDAAGYETGWIGKWHLQVAFPAFKSGRMPGFDVLPLAGRDPHKVDKDKEGKGLTVDPNTADAAIKFLRQPHQKPFLLVASVLNPHDICEYPECAALRTMLPDDPAKLPPARPNLRATDMLPSALRQFGRRRADWTERQWREYLWVYYRLVEIADAEVGRVLAALDQAGLSSSTVVVFTADHGEMMGSHQMVTKQKLYEEAAAVPLIVAPPATKPAVDSQHFVSGLDILPTLLDYAGVAAPPSLRGRSVRPLLEGKPVPWREYVASECSSGGDARMIRTARYKYIAFARGENREQFFDMEKDPGETKNLIADSALAGEVARHRGLLEQWLKETQDAFGKEPTPLKGKKKERNRKQS